MKATLKKLILDTPLELIARSVLGRGKRLEFSTSGSYWEERYQHGGTSGAGSYGRLAKFKAGILNDFVAQHGITSVIEFGSGDGNQLTLARYPFYTGVDVSETAVRACRARFAQDEIKSFLTLSEYDGRLAEMSLSLDVIYHLVEDATYEAYMTTLFDASQQFVIIYASNKDEQPPARHVRHRRFTDWVDIHRPTVRLIDKIPNRFPYDPADPNNTSFADFHIFATGG